MSEPTTGFTLEDLVNLERAMAKGAKVVQYEDKKVEYRSLEEMQKLADYIRAQLGLAKAPRGTRRIGQTNKGLG